MISTAHCNEQQKKMEKLLIFCFVVVIFRLVQKKKQQNSERFAINCGIFYRYLASIYKCYSVGVTGMKGIDVPIIQ